MVREIVTTGSGGTTRSIAFTVVAPSSVRMQRAATSHEDNSFPNAGMTASVFIGPDDVNFGATTNSEDDAPARGDGCWGAFDGVGHFPSSTPNGCSGRVVPNYGTHSPGDDTIDSGCDPNYVPPGGDWSGTLVYDIPWRWQCGSSSGLIGNVAHSQDTDASGTTTISKADASYTAALSP
jgi:hypothetical protein